jgi:hypothetical protein
MPMNKLNDVTLYMLLFKLTIGIIIIVLNCFECFECPGII